MLFPASAKCRPAELWEPPGIGVALLELGDGEPAAIFRFLSFLSLPDLSKRFIAMAMLPAFFQFFLALALAAAWSRWVALGAIFLLLAE